MSSMQRFYWQGIDVDGRHRRGWSLATEHRQLQAHLLEHRIILQSAKALPTWVEKLAHPTRAGIDEAQITRLLRELAVLLDAGIPMLQALEMLAAQTRHTGLRHLLGRLRERVASGMPLSSAFADDTHQSDPLLLALIRAGEASSRLTPLLYQIAEQRQQAARLRDTVKRALIYPVTVLALAGLVTLALLVWVVPRFERLFADFGAELPAFTQAIIQASDQLRSMGWFTAGLAAVMVILTALLPRFSEPAAHLRDRLLLRIPIAGAVIEQAAIVRFTRTLAIMIRAGVPLVDTLPVLARTLRNRCYRKAVMAMRDAIQDGHTIADAMQQTDAFPPAIPQMLAVGEASGEIETMLEHIAEREQALLDETIKGLSSRIEPVVMVLLGLVIGGLVLAMYLPVFQLGSAV